MNFIAGSILYHANEVYTFNIMIALMNKFNMKEIFKSGLPGLYKHDQIIERLGKKFLP